MTLFHKWSLGLAMPWTVLFSALAAWPQQSPPPEQQPAASFRVDVNVVRIAASATQHGVPVKGLTKDDFRVREDAAPQPIKYFWQEHDLPLTVGLIVDVSGSQATLVHNHRETLKRFFQQVLRPEDRAMIVTVGPQARILNDFTASQEDLARGIERIKIGGRAGDILGEPCKGKSDEETADPQPRRHGRRVQRLRRAPCGGTALWHGVYWAARARMKDVTGRKALIVISDGWDTGSDRSLEDAIEAAQGAETPVYTIKFVDRLLAVLNPTIGFRHPMERLSDETGGLGFGMMHGDLGRIFDQIDEDLRNLYVLGYTPANREPDGKFRKLEVTCSRPGVKVRTRSGYWARAEQR